MADLNKLNFMGLTDKELDQPIYRIMKQEYVIRLFTKQENTLSQIHKWKDKFEGFQLALSGLLDGESSGSSFKDNFVCQCWTREYLSDAMWGIYANDCKQRFLRIRSTPRKLLAALVDAHPNTAQNTCFLGKVAYRKEEDLETLMGKAGQTPISTESFAHSLLLKRHKFRHESEVRLIYFGDAKDYENGLYHYAVDPYAMITQIMADPNRDRGNRWTEDKKTIESMTGFKGEIKRSKAYDPPDYKPPILKSGG